MNSVPLNIHFPFLTMPINFSFREFRSLSPESLYTWLSLRIAVFVVEQNCPYQECDDKDLHAIHLLGEEEGKLVAGCRILPPGISYEGYASIGRVVTHQNARGKGYGKLLMLEAMAYCRAHFPAPVKISAQAYLERFYTELGFQTVSKPYLEDDIPHVAMVMKQS